MHLNALLSLSCSTWCATLSTETATAILMLLPNWKDLSADASMLILREHLNQSTILGTCPQASVTYRQQEFWIGGNASTPAPLWDFVKIIKRNKE